MDLKYKVLCYRWYNNIYRVLHKINFLYFFFVNSQQNEKKKKSAISTRILYKSYRLRRKKKQLIVAKKQIPFPLRFDNIYAHSRTVLTNVYYDETIEKFIIFALESGYFSYRELRAFLIALRRGLKRHIRFFRMRRFFFFLSVLTKKTKGARMGKGRGHNFIYLYPIFLGQPLFSIICFKEKSFLIYQYFFSFKHKLSLNVRLLVSNLIVNIDHIKCLYYISTLYNFIEFIMLNDDDILLYAFNYDACVANMENYLVTLMPDYYSYSKATVDIA